MRVLFVSSGLNPQFGGPAFSEASLCEHLKSRVDLKVLCRREKIEPAFVKSFRFEVRPFETRDLLAACFFSNSWLAIVLRNCDVVHLNGHWNWRNYLIARLGYRHGAAIVLHPRGMLLIGHRRIKTKRLFNLLLGNWIVHRAKRLIALSQFEVDQFAPYKIPPQRITIVPNGISASVELSNLKPKEMDPYFLYLGRIESRKNLLFLVDAFHRYLKRGGTARLRLIGPVERGYDRLIADKIAALGLNRQVGIEKPIYDEEKWKTLKFALGVAYPTIDEPFGRVPFEALLAGSPPIVPDRSGAAEYLRKLIPDSIYRDQDAAALSETLSALEKRSAPGFLGRLQNAQAWVKKDLDWEKISGRMVEVYLACTDTISRVSLRGSDRTRGNLRP